MSNFCYNERKDYARYYTMDIIYFTHPSSRYIDPFELKSNITIFIFGGHNKFRISDFQILPIVTFQPWV